jgi:C4-dicarboxylate-specific signal transduction histidine kinase
MTQNKLSNLLLAILLSTVAGQAVPLLFISIDLMELGLPWSFENGADVYKSQLIYLFSSVTVPIFIYVLYMQFKRIASQRIFLNRILDGMSEQIVVLNNDLEPTFKNRAFANSLAPFKMDDLFEFKDKTEPFEWTCGEGSSLRTFVCSFSKLNDLTGTMLILEDITDFKRKDELLKTQEQSMISSSRLASLGEMAAGIAHEINNPLAVIIGRSEMILSQLADGSATDVEVNKTLSKINDMAHRISKVVTSMRRVSKAGVKEEIVATNLFFAIEDVLNLSAERVRNSLIELDFSGVNQNTSIQVNMSQLSQVLINLLGNSIDELLKNAEDNRRIWLSNEEIEGQVILKIRDSGAGIPVNVREKLFQPFYTTKEIGVGTGLGLSISKALMIGMGGDLELSPDLSQTCFILKFRKA